jgi:hypothetical protein
MMTWNTNLYECPAGKEISLSISTNDGKINFVVQGQYVRKFEIEDNNEGEFYDFHEESGCGFLPEGFFEISTFSDEFTYFFIPETHKVIAWQPLPEPYKPESEASND